MLVYPCVSWQHGDDEGDRVYLYVVGVDDNNCPAHDNGHGGCGMVMLTIVITRMVAMHG